MFFKNFLLFCLCYILLWTSAESTAYYSKAKKLELREKVKSMFQHAYDGYINYAQDYDELRPLSCDGINTWGSYSLTLIDALDTLATMGNFTEFRRVANLLLEKMNFDKDLNVSVFETNIRIVGGLLSAHLLSKKAGMELEPGWPCTGPLLRMAEDVAKRLLPAFETATLMPYGTVNLRYGIPKGETTVTCTAGVGTFFVEFGTLSRLTGNPIYEKVALNAVHALWEKRSQLNLFGNHIDVQTGRWTALDAGIGAGVDSFFEYLVKGAMLLNRPELLEMFHEARAAIDIYLKRDDFYVWVNMNKGQVTLPVFQSLEAFWPGMLALVGDIAPAMRTIVKYGDIWKKYGFLPEFYNIFTGETPANRESYPLRPELIESAMYLYRATGNQYLLELGEHILESIEFGAKTKCGFATIRNVVTHEKENRMESFFLAETTKYLYLLFDEDNFLHNDASTGDHLETPNGACAVNAGPYIFNTEAHPMDLSALYCCHDLREDIYEDMDLSVFRDDVLMKADRQQYLLREKNNKYLCPEDQNIREEPRVDKASNQVNEKVNSTPDSQITVDIEVFDEENNPAGELLVENFERIKQELRQSDSTQVQNQLTVSDLNQFFSKRSSDFESIENTLEYVLQFMQNFTLDTTMIAGLKLYDKNISSTLGAVAHKDYESRTRTLWELYELQEILKVNVMLVKKMGLLAFEGADEKRELLDNILKALNHSQKDEIDEDESEEAHKFKNVWEQIKETREKYSQSLVNTTAMQEFLLRILINGTNEKKRSFKPLLQNDDIESLPSLPLSEAQRLQLFSYVRRVVEFKRRMIDTFEKLQSLMQESGKIGTQKEFVPEFKNNKNPTKENVAFKDEDIHDNMVTSSTVENTTPINNNNDSNKNNNEESVWSQFVQTILRKTSIHREKFDEQKLLQKVDKSLQRYTALEKSGRYELFSCQRPRFIEQFAFREFYP